MDVNTPFQFSLRSLLLGLVLLSALLVSDLARDLGMLAVIPAAALLMIRVFFAKESP